MNDKIIAMAKEAGFGVIQHYPSTLQQLSRFRDLVLEEAAEALVNANIYYRYDERGVAHEDAINTAFGCAAAIRALKGVKP